MCAKYFGLYQYSWYCQMLIGRNLKILPNVILVYFWKIAIIAKCNIAKILKNIPIMDNENIAKKTTYGGA